MHVSDLVLALPCQAAGLVQHGGLFLVSLCYGDHLFGTQVRSRVKQSDIRIS